MECSFVWQPGDEAWLSDQMSSHCSFRSRKFDNHLNRRAAQFEEQNKIIVMPVADLTVDQFNLGAKCVLEQLPELFLRDNGFHSFCYLCKYRFGMIR